MFKEKPTKLIAVQTNGDITLLFTVTSLQTQVMCSKCTRRDCKHYQQFLSESETNENGDGSSIESTEDEDITDSDSENNDGGESEVNDDGESEVDDDGDTNRYVPDHYEV